MAEHGRFREELHPRGKGGRFGDKPDLPDAPGSGPTRSETQPKPPPKPKVPPVMALFETDSGGRYTSPFAAEVARANARMGPDAKHALSTWVHAMSSDGGSLEQALRGEPGSDLDPSKHERIMGQLEEQMGPLREALSALVGDKITLFRGQKTGPFKQERAALSWTPDRRLAEEFARGKGEVVEQEFAVADTVAIIDEGGGVEFIMRTHPDDDAVDVGGDVNRAADLIAEGVKVRLDQPRTASTLLKELADRVQEAKRLGADAPNYNLCLVTVRDTNLFCAESKGVPRIKMPQLSGVPLPGSPADELPKNDKGEVDLAGRFREMLEGRGVRVDDEKELASFLRASQIELNGAKVAGMTQWLDGGNKLPDARLFVSHDNYIVDGHHRWAANVAHDVGDNKLGDVDMDVARIDMDIIEILDEANRFAADWGIPQAGVEAKVPEARPDESKNVHEQHRGQPGERVDLSYLADTEAPTPEEDRPLALVLQPADGSDEHRYDTTLGQAWTFGGDPYDLLASSFEDPGDGTAWFEEWARGEAAKRRALGSTQPT